MNEVYFSIVIPVWNREGEILRALRSCQKQSFSSWEAIVVDDASTDNTCSLVQGLQDERIVLLRHRQNRGVGPARNTGIEAVRGQWVLFLDSDDELLPDALGRIRDYAQECAEDIARLGFLYCRDDGGLSPEPTPQECILSYEAYLQKSAVWNPSDFFHCTRKEAFAQIRFPDSLAFEASYLLDFAKLFKTRMVPDVVAQIHTDSANRDSNLSMVDGIEKLLRHAKDQAAATGNLLQCHGDALKCCAPERRRLYRKAEVFFLFLSGDRYNGFKKGMTYLWNYPRCVSGWAILLAGLLDKRLLASIQIWKNRRV